MNAARYRRGIVLACAPLLLASCATSRTHEIVGSPTAADSASSRSTARFVREELYFGVKRQSAEVVSDAEWTRFLREVVTPRFPDGLTVLRGYGQYRLADGTIEEEGTHVIVLLYENAAATASVREARIAEIIRYYKDRYDQESVLRVTSFVQAAF
jgi:hypothetical protein